MKTFKQTYFGASKSQSYDENLFKNVKNEEIATASVEQGRTIFLIIILGNPSNIRWIISNTNLKKMFLSKSENLQFLADLVINTII